MRLYERLGRDGPDQLSHHDPGVGTQNDARNLPVCWLDRLAESVSGMGITSDGLDGNVTETYRYLMDCHETQKVHVIYTTRDVENPGTQELLRSIFQGQGRVYNRL